MAQVNRWDGGLNIRQNASLININEGIVYSNVDNAKGSLCPIKGDLYSGSIQGTHAYFYKKELVVSDRQRSYVEFQNKLYYSDGITKPQKSIDGITWHQLGIDAPTTALTLALGTAGNLTGTIQYCYTYYNSIDGSESAPNLYSATIVASSHRIVVSGLLASVDTQVTNIKLYRLGGSLTSMFLVATLSNTNQSYTDNIADIDIPGFPLDLTNFGAAQEGLNYLVEANAMFFGSIGNRLYYSEIANVNSWSPFNYIVFDQDITGIGVIQNGLAIFTFNKSYIVTGTSPVTLNKYLASGNQGCIHHNTIKFVNNTLVWLSNDGICASNGGAIQILTKDKLGLKVIKNPKDSAVYNEVYYLSYEDETLVLDFRYGTVIRTIDIAPVSFSSTLDDLLYYTHDSKLYILGYDFNNKVMDYHSGKIAEGSLTNLKKYKSVYINSTGNLELSIYLDDTLVCANTLLGGTEEILIPIETLFGYSLSYRVTGTGELLELEYKAEGRQNGK